MKNWFVKVAVAIATLLAVATGGFVWWGNNPLEAMPEASVALESDESVQVSLEDWIVFTARQSPPESGVIFYPGGHVDPHAYAPLLKQISADGYLVVMPPMPLNLAVFNINVADDIVQANPHIKTWMIGGHSLGGAMAASYVAGNPAAMDGLFLWASYSAENTDLSGLSNLAVLSIYGTEDGDVEGIRASRERLPEDAMWVEIDGANHAQFGWYGVQSGDGVATISREAQQAIVLENTLLFLHAIEE